MKPVLVLIPTALAAALVATAMSALTELDADGDGMVSYAELLAAYPDTTEATFQTIDANTDGLIDEAEMTAAETSGLLPKTEG